MVKFISSLCCCKHRVLEKGDLVSHGPNSSNLHNLRNFDQADRLPAMPIRRPTGLSDRLERMDEEVELLYFAKTWLTQDWTLPSPPIRTYQLDK
jgi:hypothetical protein